MSSGPDDLFGAPVEENCLNVDVIEDGGGTTLARVIILITLPKINNVSKKRAGAPAHPRLAPTHSNIFK